MKSEYDVPSKVLFFSVNSQDQDDDTITKEHTLENVDSDTEEVEEEQILSSRRRSLRFIFCATHLLKKQKYEFRRSSSSKKKLNALRNFSRTSLGHDESSDHFLLRQKAIAFVYVNNGEIFRLDQDYFIQNSAYNDFSGGYKRYYKLIPEHIINKAAKYEILKFKRYFGIPDKTIMLVQLQSSFLGPIVLAEGNSLGENSVTGQGIHTDGAHNAMLLCLERTNVHGAVNSFFEDVKGEHRLGHPTVLQSNDLVYFHDNEIYHHVSSATHIDTSAPMRRSVMLIHSPADVYLNGSRNENNILATKIAQTKLREGKELSYPTIEQTQT